MIFRDAKAKTDVNRKTSRPVEEIKRNVSDCHISVGREWECAAAGHPHGRQLDRSLIV